MMIRIWIFLVALVMVVSPSPAQCFERIGSIELQSISEKQATIAPDKDFTVLFFLGTDCPISQKYMHRIAELQNQFEKKVAFYAIVPKQFTVDEIIIFQTEYKSALIFLRDDEMKMISYLDAKVTPEVFLFDKEFELRYKGAIDNWFYELGKYRRVTSDHYLIDALQSVLGGEDPIIMETEAIGCLIQKPISVDHQHH